MSGNLAPGSTFAGCRLEKAVGRGGTGVVFRATQIAQQRRVALKAIDPDLSADAKFRQRFQRESDLAASVQHPNVIPVYEFGERQGTLYLLTRWVEGTDLGRLLTTSGRLSPARAIVLLRPVASALAIAHRRGLVHRDVKPTNVLIANEGHVYLTDFGIGRRPDGEPITAASTEGVGAATLDYTAPELMAGGQGDARSDIYSVGCVLFEALTGHVPFARPTDAAKISGHVHDPTPSARAEVEGVPQQLDEILAKAMAKQPEDRFGSAGQLNVALGNALQELETRPRGAPRREPEIAKAPVSAEVAEPVAEVAEPVAEVTEPPPAVTEPPPAVTAPAAAVTPPPAATRPAEPPRRAPTPSRSKLLWVAPLVVVVVAAVLIIVLTGGKNKPPRTTATSHPGTTGAVTHPVSTAATTTPSAGSGVTEIKLSGSGLTEGRTTDLSSPAASISIGPRNVWISLPARAEIVRLNPATGAQRMFAVAQGPAAIVVGRRAVWVAQTTSRSLAQFNGDTGDRVAVARLPGSPTTIALDHGDSSAWVADSTGTISHVAVGGAVSGTPEHVAPAPTGVAWGEGWLWAVRNAPNGLVRLSLGTSGASTSYPVGPRLVGVAIDQGVWIAGANGHVSRFDPRPGHLQVDADIAVAPELDAIAATDPSPFVWAISQSARTLYRITNTSRPVVTGSVVFGSPPVALGANSQSVWVATQDGRVTQIRF